LAKKIPTLAHSCTFVLKKIVLKPCIPLVLASPLAAARRSPPRLVCRPHHPRLRQAAAPHALPPRAPRQEPLRCCRRRVQARPGRLGLGRALRQGPAGAHAAAGHGQATHSVAAAEGAGTAAEATAATYGRADAAEGHSRADEGGAEGWGNEGAELRVEEDDY
jgi:hypothetical protein